MACESVQQWEVKEWALYEGSSYLWKMDLGFISWMNV